MSVTPVPDIYAEHGTNEGMNEEGAHYALKECVTCRTIKVPSLEGVMAGSLSTSSCTIMVFTDSVSPLLRFKVDLSGDRVF